MRMPRLVLALALCVLAALAGTLTYAGYLVVGVLADYLGTGRFLAGLLLGALFARFPRISDRKLRLVGLLPKPARRPLMAGLLALCFLHLLARGEYVPAGFIGFTTAFLLAYPWLRRALVDRLLSAVFPSAGRKFSRRTDDSVIDGEFKVRED